MTHRGPRFRRLWSMLRHARASNTWPVHAVSSYPSDILFEIFVGFSCCQSTNVSKHTAPTHLQIEATCRTSHEVHVFVPVLVKLSRQSFRLGIHQLAVFLPNQAQSDSNTCTSYKTNAEIVRKLNHQYLSMKGKNGETTSNQRLCHIYIYIYMACLKEFFVLSSTTSLRLDKQTCNPIRLRTKAPFDARCY